MCGIAGFLNFNNLKLETIKDLLYHRGPDDQTDFSYQSLQLIHTRLSIQDVQNGSQPFVIGKFVIVFNGEIYNHQELRKLTKSHNYRSNSDTETILALYIEMGAKIFDLVDGMFALCILNMKNNTLFFARDRVGKKPLYIFKRNNQFAFASELNVLSKCIKDLSIDEKSINTFLRCGFIPNSFTPYENISEVLPGHTYEFDLKTFKVSQNRFFSIEDLYRKSRSEIFEPERFDEIIHKSVKSRLLSSDFPVGIFLSGGIDSSIILEHSSRILSNIKTFTINFGGKNDESEIAKKLAKKYSTDHKTISISNSIHEKIEDILALYGEPFMDSSAIPSFYVSQAASKYVKVALNGDGADEQFGGYRRYVPLANNLLTFSKKLKPLGSLLFNPSNKQSLYNYLFRLIQTSDKEGLDFYLSLTNDIFEDVYDFGNKNSYLKNFSDSINKYNEYNFSKLNKALVTDTNILLPYDLLKKMDIATMANSIEVRSPFLSKYILEYSSNLQETEKVRGITTKYALRMMAKKYGLENWNLSKKGFEVPLSRWVDHELKERIQDRLVANSYCSNFVSDDFIQKTLRNTNNIPNEKRAKILWSLYALEIWKNNQSKTSSIKDFSVEIPIKKKNILLMTTGLGLGGAERIVHEIVSNIDRKKFAISLVSLSQQIATLKKFTNEDIPIQIINNKKSIFDFLKTVLTVSKIIRNENIDIVHAHMFHSILVSSFVKILNPNLKILFTSHNTYISMFFRRIALFFLRPLRNLDTIFPGNEKKFFNKKSSYDVPNGVNFDSYKSIKPYQRNDKFIFLMIGRLEKVKNHSAILKIASQLDKFDFEIRIVGSGKLENKLKKMTSELNIEHKVKFLGPLNDTSEELSKAHCLLLSSLWEASPIVIFEAVASNLPLISTPVGNVAFTLSDACGIVTNIENFRESMINMMTNFDFFYKKSKKAKFTIKKRYDFSKIVREYESLYHAVKN